MTTLTVEIDKERDLPALQALLIRMGLKFQLEDAGDWGGLSAAEIEGIEAGIADFKAGRVHSHDDVMAHINAKLNR